MIRHPKIKDAEKATESLRLKLGRVAAADAGYKVEKRSKESQRKRRVLENEK